MNRWCPKIVPQNQTILDETVEILALSLFCPVWRSLAGEVLLGVSGVGIVVRETRNAGTPVVPDNRIACKLNQVPGCQYLQNN